MTNWKSFIKTITEQQTPKVLAEAPDALTSKIKMSTSVRLTIPELFKAIESGALTGRKITRAEWEYKSVGHDDGRGGGYEEVVSGVKLYLR